MENRMKEPMLVIFGLDAGDPDLLEKWAADGSMPNLQKIMGQGCWGRTTGADLLFEHGAWLSITSGISRRENGYHYFRQLKPQSYELELKTGPDFAAPPFWSLISGNELRIAIIDVPDTTPIPGLPGIQLSDWAVHDPQHPPAAQPPELLAEVKRLFGKQNIIDEKYESNIDNDQLMRQQLLQRVEKKGDLCRHLLAQDEYGLVFIGFAEAHTGAHQFWKYRPGAQGLEAVPAPNPLQDAVHDIYQAIDRELGALLAELPPAANLFVVSSVGLLDHYPMSGLIEDFCFKLGYQVPPPSGGESRSLPAVGRRLIPESWRIALSKRLLSREAREKIVSNQFQMSSDWSRTAAFATPASHMSFLWINLRGRQPQGIVAPGPEYEELLGRLTADLQQLINPETGQKAVARVWHVCELFDLDPLHSSAA